MSSSIFVHAILFLKHIISTFSSSNLSHFISIPVEK